MCHNDIVNIILYLSYKKVHLSFVQTSQNYIFKKFLLINL